MKSNGAEPDEVRARYGRRLTAGLASRYDPFRPENLCLRQDRERAIVALLSKWLAGRSLSGLKILEIGCGDGGNLLDLIRMGARPWNLFANDLLEERLATARANLPTAVTALPGDATKLELSDASFDLIVQSTVFSSILDPEFRKLLAGRMAQLLKPGGAVLWYDFVYDNPSNNDVTGIRLAEIRRLFEGFDLDWRRVTLAPPISRRLGRFTMAVYPLLNAFPFLRTHVVCLAAKPVGRPKR